MTNHEKQLKPALRAIAEGYPVTVEHDRWIVVKNPKFEEGGRYDPNLVIDVDALSTPADDSPITRTVRREGDEVGDLPYLETVEVPADGREQVAKRCAALADDLATDELFLDEKGRYGAKLIAATIRDEFGLEKVGADAIARRRLYGPYGWLNGHRALSEERWELESDPLESNEEYFSIPLYTLIDPFKETGRDFKPEAGPSPSISDEAVERAELIERLHAWSKDERLFGNADQDVYAAAIALQAASLPAVERVPVVTDEMAADALYAFDDPDSKFISRFDRMKDALKAALSQREKEGGR